MRWRIILAIAAAHFVAGLAALFFSFGNMMSRFDAPAPAPGDESWAERFVDLLSTVLHFPVVAYWPFPAPGAFGYLVFALNSLLWGVCLYGLGRPFLWALRRMRGV